jgi:hypothetical protein
VLNVTVCVFYLRFVFLFIFSLHIRYYLHFSWFIDSSLVLCVAVISIFVGCRLKGFECLIFYDANLQNYFNTSLFIHRNTYSLQCSDVEPPYLNPSSQNFLIDKKHVSNEFRLTYSR